MATYNGQACSVTIAGDTIEVSLGDSCVVMNTHECEFHRALNELTITSADGILKLTSGEAGPLWKPSAKSLAPALKWGAIVAAFVCVIIFGPRIMAGPISKLIPVQTERGWFHVKDEAGPLRTLLAEIPSTNDISVTLTQDEDINAFALPGANVQLTKGALCFSENADEVVGLLAHEVGHVRLRHSIRSVISNLSLAVLSGVFLGGGLPMNIANQLASQSYSVDDEREADAYAATALQAANIAPSNVGNFFERLEKKQPVPFESVLSDHPLIKKRVAYFRSSKLGGIPVDPRASQARETAWTELRVKNCAQD